MIQRLLSLFFCTHERVTWPQKGRTEFQLGMAQRGWQSCLDCGRRRAYVIGEGGQAWR